MYKPTIHFLNLFRLVIASQYIWTKQLENLYILEILLLNIQYAHYLLGSRHWFHWITVVACLTV